ncbi:hypothetical protein [Nesterenkonia lutea]|uniref:Leucine rich repeat variant domain-containing protein n=1 Tax=Nesterenkonia lutea TaxID=272919 RepID=A0ABR9JF36_9MICC|nr:hypothetical protein [Nesterenkonia lutea]MBE1524541.1 hypothetical protein [Nesterenkonia lutea]
MPSIYDELGAMAADPSTDWDTLHWIAEHHPELRPAVAGNPATYPELIEALGALGDPAINAALHRRAQREASAPPGAPAQEPAPSQPAPASEPAVPVSPSQPAAPASPSQPVSEAQRVPQARPIPRARPVARAHPAAADPIDDDERSRPARGGPRARRLALTVLLPLLALAAVAALVLNLLGDSGDPVGEPMQQGATAQPSPAESGAEADPEDDADSGADAGSEGEPGTESSEETSTPAQLRAAAAALPAESSCEAAAEDRDALTRFAEAVITEDGDWSDPSDAALVQETLTGLQTSCGNTYAARIYLDLQGTEQDVPAPLLAAVDSMGSAWIQASFSTQGQQLDAFASPDGNVLCELADTLRCTVLQHSFSAPEDCTSGATYALEVDRAAEPDCDDPVTPAGQPVLGHGQTASNAFYACSAFPSQMSCWNQLTGEGINLSASRNATY